MQMRLQHIAGEDAAAEAAHKHASQELDRAKQQERDAKEARRNASAALRYGVSTPLPITFHGHAPVIVPGPAIRPPPQELLEAMAQRRHIRLTVIPPTQEVVPQLASDAPMPTTMVVSEEKQPLCISVKAIEASAIINANKGVENRTWVISPGDYWLRTSVIPAKKELVDHINGIALDLPIASKGHIVALVRIGSPVEFAKVLSSQQPWCITGHYHHPIQVLRVLKKSVRMDVQDDNKLARIPANIGSQLD